MSSQTASPRRVRIFSGRVPRFIDLPLFIQLLLVRLLLLTVIGGIAVVEYRQTRLLEVTTVNVQQTLAVESFADNAAAESARMNESYRDIVSGGGLADLQSYLAARASLVSDVGQVLSLTSSDPTLQASWQQIMRHLTMLDGLIDPNSALPNAELPQALPLAQLLNDSPAIIAQLDAIEALVDQGRASEHEALRDFTKSAATSSHEAKLALIIGTGSLLIVSILLTLLWSRQVVDGMAAFASTAKDIAAGRLGRRLHMDRKDEIGQAARAFDSMAEQVQTLIRERTKQVECEARERGVLTTILNSMQELVYQVDPDGHLVRVNEPALSLSGRTSGTAVGQLAVEVLRWRDENGRILDADEYAFQALLRGEPVAKRLYYATGPSGKQIPYRCTASPIHDRSGRISAVVEVARDISQEAEANKLKDQIISLVSHELRTPVGNIKGFADSLLQPDVSWDDSTVHDFISEINKEADRLTALIGDLLDMSRIESGQAVAHREPCLPGDIAARAIKARHLATSEHAVVNTVADDLPVINVDPAQMERVLGNLLENAAKYSPKGSTIQLSVWPEAATLEWCIEDQGPGIPADYRDRVFEKFVRIFTGRRQPPGTGLGLPICKGIVEAHGGRIWVEPAARAGSRFRFSLPVQDEADATASAQ